MAPNDAIQDPDERDRGGIAESLGETLGLVGGS